MCTCKSSEESYERFIVRNVKVEYSRAAANKYNSVKVPNEERKAAGV